MKRKFGCVLLAFVMMLATVPLLGLPAFAEESVNLLTNVEKGNGQVTVTISVDNYVDAVKLDMVYDSFSFELIEAKGVRLENAETDEVEYYFGDLTDTDSQGFCCSWVNNEKGGTTTENGLQEAKPYKGDLFKLVFNIRNTAKPGEYAFDLQNCECEVFSADDAGNKIVESTLTPNVDTTTNKVELLDEDIPKGVTVSGEVQSYNPKNDITVELKKGDNIIADTVLAGQTTGSGQITQKFTIEAVPEGTYDLVVTKAGHLTYTIQNVIVGNEDIDLAAMTGKAYQIITLLAGDVNGDGYIESGDLNIIWNAANYNKSFESADNKNADLNGDGYIESSDLNIVWNSNNYNKTAAAHCTVSY